MVSDPAGNPAHAPLPKLSKIDPTSFRAPRCLLIPFQQRLPGYQDVTCKLGSLKLHPAILPRRNTANGGFPFFPRAAGKRLHLLWMENAVPYLVGQREAVATWPAGQEVRIHDDGLEIDGERAIHPETLSQSGDGPDFQSHDELHHLLDRHRDLTRRVGLTAEA